MGISPLRYVYFCLVIKTPLQRRYAVVEEDRQTMTTTTNYQLNILADDDPVAVQPLNENFQKLDEKIADMHASFLKFISGEMSCTKSDFTGNALELWIDLSQFTHILDLDVKITLKAEYYYAPNGENSRTTTVTPSGEFILLFPEKNISVKSKLVLCGVGIVDKKVRIQFSKTVTNTTSIATDRYTFISAIITYSGKVVT